MKALAFALMLVAAACTAALARIDISAPGATATPPPPGPPTTARFPVPLATTLPNGLRVIAVRSGNVPLVTAQLLSARGSASDPAGKHGTAALGVRAMLAGTTTRAARAIALATDELGAELSTTPGPDSTSISVDATSDKFAAALELLADVTRHPTFPAAELERLRKQTQSAFLETYGNTEALASVAVTRALFGTEGYGNPVAGTPASTATITRADVIGFHRRAFRPDLCVLVIGGDLAPRAAFSLARRAFGAWRNPSERAVPTAPVSVATAPRFIVIDKPDAGAAIVAAAFRTVARSAADYPAGAVANAVLTGYSGRLNSEVRIKRGLAYGAYAALNAYATDGILVAQTASVENPKIPEATAVVSATLRDFAAATVGPDELSARRLAALGERSYQLQRERGVVALLATNARYGLAPTAVAAEAAAERSITPAEVHAFARRYLERATIVVIGKAAAFLPALRAAHPDLEVVPFARLDLDSPRLRAPTLGG